MRTRWTYHDDVDVKILADIDITLHDGVEGGDVDTAALEAEDGGLEESLGGAEALVADGDDLAVRKLVGLLEAGALGSSLDLLLKVEGDVAELLLDVTNDFTLGGGGERVSTLSEDLHQGITKVMASQVKTKDGMWEGIALIYRNCHTRSSNYRAGCDLLCLYHTYDFKPHSSRWN